MSLYYGRLETPNFIFDAFGRTGPEVRAAIKRGWERHRTQTGASWTWADIEIVYVRKVELGVVYRDGEWFDT